jgi:hypothetical protein
LSNRVTRDFILDSSMIAGHKKGKKRTAAKNIFQFMLNPLS